MTLYQADPVEATRWFHNGDLPDDRLGERLVDPVKLGDLRPDLIGPNGWKLVANTDIPDEAYYYRGEGAVVRYFRRAEPEYRGDRVHAVCLNRWHAHGWIDDGGDGQTVCPGDWVVTEIPANAALDRPAKYRPVHNPMFRATYTMVAPPQVVDRRPHSRACGIQCFGHGLACSADCPTCGGRPIEPVVEGSTP